MEFWELNKKELNVENCVELEKKLKKKKKKKSGDTGGGGGGWV